MTTIVTLGIDPGLANLGLGAVERHDDGSFHSRGVKVVSTEKNQDKAHSRQRSTFDDQRRIRELWQAITNTIAIIKPHAIGIENYSVRTPLDVISMQAAMKKLVEFWSSSVKDAPYTKLASDEVADTLVGMMGPLTALVAAGTSSAVGLGQAAKTIAVYGAALGAAFSAGVPVFVFEPADRALQLVGKKGASKEEVGAAITKLVIGLDAQMNEKVPQKTKKDHAWDATCFAVLASREYVQLKLDLGAT